MPKHRTELYLTVGEQDDTKRHFVCIDIEYSYSPAQAPNYGQRGAPEPGSPVEATILGVGIVFPGNLYLVLPEPIKRIIMPQLVAEVLRHEDAERAVKRHYRPLKEA